MNRVTITIAGKQRPRLVAEQIDDDTIAAGVGGWEVLPRPFRTPMTAWTGSPGISWTLPLSFDGLDATSSSSVERELATLESWGKPSDDRDVPPPLTVHAQVGRGAATAKWVIQDIAYGAQVRNDAGDRIRQDLTLTLLEYEPGQIRKGPAAKSRDGKTHKWVAKSAKDRRCKVCNRQRDDKRHSNR